MLKKKVVILTGAGMSAESGLKTFRDANGLWEGHDVMQVASPQGWRNNMELVLDFYNQRRRQLKNAQPNKAHRALVELESKFDVTVITQNIDDLHERAGSSSVIHLHGELFKAKSCIDDTHVVEWQEDILVGDLCPQKGQMRPHVVWFGEPVPLLEEASVHTSKADFIIIVGTSMQVYPAAGLIDFAKPDAQIFFIDPRPNISSSSNLKVLAEKASTGVPTVVAQLLDN